MKQIAIIFALAISGTLAFSAGWAEGSRMARAHLHEVNRDCLPTIVAVTEQPEWDRIEQDVALAWLDTVCHDAPWWDVLLQRSPR